MRAPLTPPPLFSPVHLKVRSRWWPYGTQPGSCRAHTDSSHLGRLWEDSWMGRREGHRCAGVLGLG